MLYQLAVRGYILQVASQHWLEENKWIDGRVACFVIQPFGALAEEVEAERLLEPAVKIFLRDAGGQLETGEGLSGVVFSALHSLKALNSQRNLKNRLCYY